MTEHEEIEKLKSINKRLSNLLEDHINMVLNLRRGLVAMDQTLKQHPDLSATYTKLLEDPKANESARPDPAWTAETVALLREMKQ